MMRMRAAFWRRTLTLAAAGLAALGLTACDLEEILGARHEGVRTETAAFPASGNPVVEITSSNGAVSVRGVEGQTDVRVTATVRARGRSQAQADERAAAITLHMEQQGSRIVLSYRSSEQAEDVRRFAGVAFDVSMPGIVDLVVGTSNGAVSVSSLQGRFDLQTSNGEISVVDAVGQLHAETSNGRISVERAQGVLDLSTSNGEIRMIDVSAAFDAATSNGAITFRGAAVGDANSLRTSNGRIGIAVSPVASIEFKAETSVGAITSSLPLVGDTQGKAWLATLNPPASAKVAMQTSNGAIEIVGLP
jgi:DUF4097 and DUF4098 domain-containing protein YvlB